MVIHRADAARAAPVDLNELAKSVLAKAVPLSLPREVDISFTPAPSAPVIDGDAVKFLREALADLIDNALVHGAHTRLSVTVSADTGSAWIEVGDDARLPDRAGGNNDQALREGRALQRLRARPIDRRGSRTRP